MGRSVYATIADLRQAGLADEDVYTDEMLTDRLELAADIIEAVTGQFFGPMRLVFKANGRGREIVATPERDRIIEIESVQLIAYSLVDSIWLESPSVLDGSDYSIQPRFIRLRPFDTGSSPYGRAFRDVRQFRFPNDDQNVLVTGVFGWLDPAEKLEGVLAADLAVGDTELELGEEMAAEVNDLLLIDGRFWVIVTEVDGTTVTIDPSPKAAAEEASVLRYGKVPRLVRAAAIRTVLANINAPGSAAESATLEDGRMRREKTDNYEVEFFEGAGTTTAPGTGTGDVVADGYLLRFRAPSVRIGWV